MKILNVLTHPFVLIISFLLILISGQHFGGFYFMYLLFALPHGGMHAIFGFTGILMILSSYYKFKRMRQYRIESVLNIAGLLFLLSSIFFFFYNDKKGYNYQTFDQIVPILSLVLFTVISLFYLVSNFKNTSLSHSGNK